MADVYIIGTHHEFQKDDGSKNSLEVEKFKAFLEDVCNRKGIQIIAEEMSLEALGPLSDRGSSCKQVADKLGLSHLYCDPESAERKQLGIQEQKDIWMDGFFKDRSQVDFNTRIEEERVKRRNLWLKTLRDNMRDFNRFPALFICGARHALPFRDLLIEHKMACKVLIENWLPH